MRKKILVSIAPLIPTFIPTFTRHISTTTSFIPPHFFEPNPRDTVFSYNKTIETLMKQGSIHHAHQLFDEMPQRDVVTWNILIQGYKRNGYPKKALFWYTQMVSEGFVESASTFSTVLGLCKGVEVHARVIVLGLGLDVYVRSALVDFYMSNGFFEVGLRLFDELPERNVATWNLLLRKFGEFGRVEKMEVYCRMKREGVVINEVSFCYLLRGFGNERLVDVGRELHGHAVKVGWAESDVFVSNALVDFYSACGSLSDAKRSFDVIPMEDVISWNSLVSVYACNGLSSNAVEIFSMMQIWGMKPSIRSFVGMLNMSSGNIDIFLGKQLHCSVLKLGVDIFSSYIQSSLIDMYGKCGEIDTSVSIYENISIKSLEVCNSLMTSFAKCGIVEDVIELFGLMVDDGIGFDEVSLSTTVDALSKSSYGSLSSCKLLHNCAMKSGFDHDLAVSCSLIDSYSRLGHVRASCQVFEQIPSPNVICFTSIISAHSRNKMGAECLKLLESMINRGLKPDKVAFSCVLAACNHCRMVQEGKMVFDSMKTIHGVDPESQHYACMVDLLGQTGLLEEAEGLLKQAWISDDPVIWSSLLRQCRVHHNELVGRRVAQIITKLEPENPSVWLQVSDFYSDIGEFETSKHIKDVALARKMQREMLTL